MAENIFMTPTSSNIDRLTYDDFDETLIVQFKSGDEYKYTDVPQYVFDNACSAPSVGKYFQQNIRDTFDAEKL